MLRELHLLWTFNEIHTSVFVGLFLSGINISFSFHITYLIFCLNHKTKVALQEIQSLGMALLRGLQLRNSQEIDCGTGQALTPSQRGLHGQNMPQNIEYLHVRVEEIQTPGQTQDGNFSNLCSSFQPWGTFLGRAGTESIDWQAGQEEQGWGHQSIWPQPDESVSPRERRHRSDLR